MAISGNMPFCNTPLYGYQMSAIMRLNNVKEVSTLSRRMANIHRTRELVRDSIRTQQALRQMTPAQ
jgi:hypothetical protein